jgi:small subunit ribosomal protein S11
MPKVNSEGRMYIHATFNNTLATITDRQGKVLDWTSCGRMGFKGTRKSTPFAATTTLQDAIGRLTKLGIKKIRIYIKGPGPGRDAALRILRNTPQIQVTMLSDVTPLPHNGPRPPKQKRG